jgi:hypothetical protein
LPSPYADPTARPSGRAEIDREREYPRDGADAYGALPETAQVYEGALATSPLADDPLYARGEDPAGPAAGAPS